MTLSLNKRYMYRLFLRELRLCNFFLLYIWFGIWFLRTKYFLSLMHSNIFFQHKFCSSSYQNYWKFTFCTLGSYVLCFFLNNCKGRRWGELLSGCRFKTEEINSFMYKIQDNTHTTAVHSPTVHAAQRSMLCVPAPANSQCEWMDGITDNL